jgi:predicted RNA-binding Zn ribbon-like protein
MPDRRLELLDLIGASPALDFANTVNSRVAQTHDYLGTYGALLAWADRAGLVDSPALGDLRAVGRNTGARVLRTARHRRDAIFGVFSAMAGKRELPPAELKAVLHAYGQAVARAEAVPGPAGATLRWRSDDPLRPLRPVDYDAGRLLLSTEARLVKECPGCGWLFVDRSRNQSRRWCDMQVCGSRSKMRRYHEARRAAHAEV